MIWAAVYGGPTVLLIAIWCKLQNSTKNLLNVSWSNILTSVLSLSWNELQCSLLGNTLCADVGGNTAVSRARGNSTCQSGAARESTSRGNCQRTMFRVVALRFHPPLCEFVSVFVPSLYSFVLLICLPIYSPSLLGLVIAGFSPRRLGFCVKFVTEELALERILLRGSSLFLCYSSFYHCSLLICYHLLRYCHILGFWIMNERVRSRYNASELFVFGR
jgi:hypothetical protein